MTEDPDRWLETEEAAARFSSHEEHYRHHLRCNHYPNWLAWLTVSLFCSSYIIVPTTMVVVFASTLLCYRGAHLMLAAEQMARSVPVPNNLP